MINSQTAFSISLEQIPFFKHVRKPPTVLLHQHISKVRKHYLKSRPSQKNALVCQLGERLTQNRLNTALLKIKIPSHQFGARSVPASLGLVRAQILHSLSVTKSWSLISSSDISWFHILAWTSAFLRIWL